MATKKTTTVQGHRWAGWERRYPAFDLATAFGTCECGHKFNARTHGQIRALHRAHVQEVKIARLMREDFAMLVGWARSGRQERKHLTSKPTEYVKMCKNLATIARLEAAIGKLLEQESR